MGLVLFFVPKREDSNEKEGEKKRPTPMATDAVGANVSHRRVEGRPKREVRPTEKVRSNATAINGRVVLRLDVVFAVNGRFGMTAT